MYQVSIFNNSVETVVHYPSANTDDPHVNKLPLKDGLSVVDSLSFSLYPNNQGYDKVFELSTKVKVIDLRDNTIRFSGRILNIDEKMDSNGKIYKDISCEGALSYLNDTKQRGGSYYSDTVSGFLNQILSNHNSKVEVSKQIFVGNVDVACNVIHSCNYKTTLAEILEVQAVVGGNIHIREINNIRYLDWLESFDNSIVEVSLGINMKDMVISKDITSMGTRIIPLGANNLTIESVNGGLDYIEDSNARSLYGVIEKTIEYKDIKDASQLRNTCLTDLSKYTQPLYVLKSSALDLSFITKNKADQFVLGKKLNIVNRFMGVNDVYSIVKIDLDLLAPYNPTLTITNKPITLTNTINDLRKESIQNNGIYNNVQIGSAFGIRAVRSDNKVTTTLNATDGITIENNNKKVFYVDTDGNIVCVDLTADNVTANGGTYNNIKVNKGTFDQIIATGGLTIEDDDLSCTIGAIGIALTKGNYTSVIKVGANSKNNGTAIEFDDDIIVKKDVDIKGDALMTDINVSGGAIIYGTLDCQTNLKVFETANFIGDVNIGDYTLKDYIKKVVDETI